METMPVRLGLNVGDIVGEAVPDSLVTNTRCALAKEGSSQFENSPKFGGELTGQQLLDGI